MKLVAEGAEAKIFVSGEHVIKERTPKLYRLGLLDQKLRKTRTRREVKVFENLQKLGVSVPKLFSHSDKSMIIEMELIKGVPLRDTLNRYNFIKYCNEVGKFVGLMHANNIIHGDLTTSNIIVRDEKVFFIDFGLSFFSAKTEDKAVDIHLFKQALESRHTTICKQCMDCFISTYNGVNPRHAEVLSRLEKVEMRGRYKGKGYFFINFKFYKPKA